MIWIDRVASETRFRGPKESSSTSSYALIVRPLRLHWHSKAVSTIHLLSASAGAKPHCETRPRRGARRKTSLLLSQRKTTCAGR